MPGLDDVDRARLVFSLVEAVEAGTLSVPEGVPGVTPFTMPTSVEIEEGELWASR